LNGIFHACYIAAHVMAHRQRSCCAAGSALIQIKTNDASLEESILLLSLDASKVGNAARRFEVPLLI